jgi:hypothetical protein
MSDLDALTFDKLVPSKSKFLSKEDVGEDGMILTIKGMRMETLQFDDGDEDKVVLYFQENIKPMILNPTNAQLIGLATGARTAGESKGRKIVVFNDPTVSFGKKIVGGLRIKKLSGTPKSAPNADGELNDDIPF